MDAGSIPPTFPFHVAKAYAQGAPARPAASPTITTASGLTVRPTGDSVEISGGKRPANVNKLVAAKVSQAADFKAAPAPAAASALPMYRHPADKNAAATGVELGKSVDLNG